MMRQQKSHREPLITTSIRFTNACFYITLLVYALLILFLSNVTFTKNQRHCSDFELLSYHQLVSGVGVDVDIDIDANVNVDNNVDEQNNVDVINKVENTTKSTIYLHIGPGKMGTSTIQEALSKDKIPLNQDGYCIFDPMKMNHKVGPMLLTETVENIRGDIIWRDLATFLDHCYVLQQDVLLSSENIGLITRRTFDLLLKPTFKRWNFIIVVGYRRWHSWVPSAYYETYRHAPENGWPEANNKNNPAVPSIIKWFDDIRVRRLYTHNFVEHWKLLLRGEKLNFLVYNLHENRCLVRTFYCQTLPHAMNACKKHANLASPNRNRATTLEYDRLAVAAHDVGIIPNGTSRQNAGIRLRQFFHNNMNHTVLPFECMAPEQLETVLEQSLRFEQQLVPDWFNNTGGEPAFREKFYNYAKVTYCSVLAVKAVEQYKEQCRLLFN